MKVVISQSMYFPWVGLLEQVKLADIFIHYDDVQFTRGFYNRVQIKTSNGIRWLTVPLLNYHRGQKIDQVLIDNKKNWRQQHREILRQSYFLAPYREDMLALVDDVFSRELHTVADVSRGSLLSLSEYFNLSSDTIFRDSKELGISGARSQRLLDICISLNCDTYVTGHGAINYLDHKLFGLSQINVEYMKYKRTSYPQLHGEFTPYVTALDLVANCGKGGARKIHSNSVNWKEF